MAKLTELDCNHLVEAEYAFHLIEHHMLHSAKEFRKMQCGYFPDHLYFSPIQFRFFLWYFSFCQPNCQWWQDWFISIVASFTGLWRHHSLLWFICLIENPKKKKKSNCSCIFGMLSPCWKEEKASFEIRQNQMLTFSLTLREYVSFSFFSPYWYRKEYDFTFLCPKILLRFFLIDWSYAQLLF